MKVWLDDERPAPRGWRRVKKANDAILLLCSRKVTEISLDHDLGEEKNGTGMDVASWIEQYAFSRYLPRLKWHVHSMNPVGRKNMTAALESADRFWDLVDDRREKATWMGRWYT